MPRFVHCIACARWSALLMILLSLLCGTVATAEDARNSDGTSDKKPELSWPSAWPTEVTKPLRSEKLSKAKDGAARAKSNAAGSDTKRELPQAVPEVSRPTDEASTPEAGASPKRVEGAAQEPAIRPKKKGGVGGTRAASGKPCTRNRNSPIALQPLGVCGEGCQSCPRPGR